VQLKRAFVAPMTRRAIGIRNGRRALLALVGIFVVLASVIGGFLLAGGAIPVLFQPAEFIVIGGAAFGALLVGTPPSVLRSLISQLPRLIRGARNERDYLDVLLVGFELLTIARREGLVALEKHIEDPLQSPLFSKYPSLMRDRRALTFVTDTLELLTSGMKLGDHELGELLEADLHVRKEEESRPSRALLTLADALPGLGIVAAVLGIVVTMGHIDGPPAEIGRHVGAALIGTFLGVLLSYGVAQPMGHNLAAKVEEDQVYLQVLRELMLSLHKGANPAAAVELARRSLPVEVRPTSAALSEACRALKQGASAGG
jgi:chemotaxis protein MotA